MSPTPIAHQATEIKAIPKRIYVNDVSEINGSYSSTPGGTLYSCTPGGTKIVYEKSVLMNLRNSPLSKTPPKWDIPYSIQKDPTPKKTDHKSNRHNNIPRHGSDDTEQFSLEI